METIKQNSPAIVTNEVTEKRVKTLKDLISKAHEDFMHSMKDTLENGIKAGEYLIELKETLEHGEFIEWVNNNLPFTERTAQKYMRIARNQDKLQEKGARLLSEAYNAVNDQKKPNYRDTYKESETIINNDDAFDEEIDDDFLKMKDEEILKQSAEPSNGKKPEQQKDVYSYWTDLQKLISGMNYMYRRLSQQRNSKTPRYLGYMIGNIKEMAERLETWDPDVMSDCPECDGTNKIAVQDQNGNIESQVCPYCVNGKVGSYKITKK